MIFESAELDCTSFFIAITVCIVVYFAWKSTNVREDRLAPAALLIIENSRGRLLNNTIIRQRTNIVHSPPLQSNNSRTAQGGEAESENSSTVQQLEIPQAPSLQAIIDEVNNLASSRSVQADYRAVEENINDLLEDNDLGPGQLIEEMDNTDATTDRYGHRRLGLYNRNNNSGNDGTLTQPSARRENLNFQSGDNGDNSHAENCSNENNENENISKTENRNSRESSVSQDRSNERRNEFRIKLKYLNDELRLVKGCPNEAIGDFKRRNFTVELAAEKLVRLVFNGHVLQPDSKTLEACGLFDNCVVHCLIHNKKPTATETRSNQNRSSGQSSRFSINSFLERNVSGPTFIHIGIILITLVMIFCWYCRVQYGYLFSWYSTIGLTLITAMFLVIFPLVILIEREVTT